MVLPTLNKEDRFKNEDSTIGVICSSPAEQVALSSYGGKGETVWHTGILPTRTNVPASEGAKRVATEILASLPSIRFFLLGVGSGITCQNDENIRLCDVVIGNSIVAFDAIPDSRSRLDSMNVLPASHPVSEVLPVLKEAKCMQYAVQVFQEVRYDWLDESKWHCSCKANDPLKTCPHDSTEDWQDRPIELPYPALYRHAYPLHRVGTLASGDISVNDGALRDHLRRSTGALAIMDEAAARLTRDYPCLVLYGIGDYVDGHKVGKHWGFASAGAVAHAVCILTALEGDGDVVLKAPAIK
ncbi:hypothetical protein BDV19DRAFT_385541 [Aspergillus venezuelensis]